MGVYLIGVYLTGVYLMGVHLIGVYLVGIYLIDVYFRFSMWPLRAYYPTVARSNGPADWTPRTAA